MCKYIIKACKSSTKISSWLDFVKLKNGKETGYHTKSHPFCKMNWIANKINII